jgi:CBS domain-containing protein
MHPLMPMIARERIIAAARRLLDEGAWCMYEVCVDVPGQRWEPQALILKPGPAEVADAVEREIAYEPYRDARLRGCDRGTLAALPELGECLCYLAEMPPPSAAEAPAADHTAVVRGRPPMLVRDGMNPIVVTAGPDHTLREAARRMTAHGVGAAVVMDEGQPAPGIVTERDILHSNGVGQDIDTERVRDHLTSEVVYAAADWSLERAAAAMVRGGFRHVIVVDASDVVGILSMRDIVRCWTTDGAACEAVPHGGIAPRQRAAG